MQSIVYYKHITENSVDMSLTRIAPTDEVFIVFIPDQEGETLPFPDGEHMIPFAKFVEWFNQMDELYATLAATAEAEYSDITEGGTT